MHRQRTLLGKVHQDAPYAPELAPTPTPAALNPAPRRAIRPVHDLDGGIGAISRRSMNFFPVIVGVQPVQCWLVCQLLLDKAKVISGFDDGEDSFPVIGSVTLKRQIYVDCRFHESNLEHSRMTGMGGGLNRSTQHTC